MSEVEEKSSDQSQDENPEEIQASSKPQRTQGEHLSDFSSNSAKS